MKPKASRRRPGNLPDRAAADKPAATDVLTPREFEVLRMLLAERTTEEIAELLHLSPKTVANTRYPIKGKLGAASDIELVLVALRQRILGESP